MNLQDLEMIQQERKSSKHLDGGPNMPSRMSPYGRTKVGHSIPRQLIEGKVDMEYGIPSYHRGNISDLKNVLTNDGLRD